MDTDRIDTHLPKMNHSWTSAGPHAVTAQLAERWPSVVAILVLLGTLAAFHPLLTRRALPGNAPRPVAGLPLLGAVRFFTARLPFVTEARRGSRAAGASPNFSFFLGRFPVVSLGGPDGRATLIEAKDADLNLSDGYSLLLNGRPPVKRPTEKHIQSIGILGSRMKTNQLDHCLPGLVGETRARLEEVVRRCGGGGAAGTFDPNDEMFRVAYALLLRQFGANEILRDPRLRERSQAWVQTLLASQSVTQIVFPWLGRLLGLRRAAAGVRLFRLVGGLESRRKRDGVREDDWLQQLMDAGHGTFAILAFMLSSLFAGAANTTVAACYVPAYVLTNEKWHRRLREEIDGVVARHRRDPGQTAADVLGTLPLGAWEDEFPVLQLCLHETLRFTVHNPLYRKNTSGTDIPIGTTGEVIPPESYVVLTMDEVHSDERLYENPAKWDPSRFQGDAPEGQGQYSFIGWGAGRHLCVGMRFAKLLEAIIIAHLFAIFELEATDQQGNPIVEQPGAGEEMEKVRFRFRVREHGI